MDQPTYCKVFSEKTKCLGDYEKSCVNSEAFSKAFGINARESMEFLVMEYFSQYMCKDNKNWPKTQCKIDNSLLVNGCSNLQSTTSGCEFVSSALKCIDDGMTQQCNDKEFVKYMSNGFRYVFQKVVPQCNL
uniref:DUF19 domain-containing protein n=1 Tax=Panagrolaimus sp. PS1159 TaxID=55785 RepID=A0AC35FV94_9BILA